MLPRGTVALVTGAGVGFGPAIGSHFALEGARVGLVDSNPAACAATRQRMEESGAEALVIPADVRDYESMNTAVRTLLDRWGRLDVMVNSAGAAPGERFLDLTEEGYDAHVETNLTGVFHGIRAAAAPMKAARSGCIINLSSIYEEVGTSGHAAGCAAAGGIRMLTKAAAVELAPHGIRVCAIAPGGAMTPLAQTAPDQPDDLADSLPRMPLGRPAADVAAAVVFLASPDAAYVSGATLLVDGGELTH